VWTLKVATRELTLNREVPVPLTDPQVSELVSAVTAFDYHYNSQYCPDQSSDGDYSPRLKLTSSTGDEWFSVSNRTCVASDRSFFGNVIGCSDYLDLYARFEAIAPSGEATECMLYW